MATSDSATEQLYAYGEGDRGVQMVQQYGMGQQASPSYGKAAEFNVKTGAGHFVNSDVIQCSTSGPAAARDLSVPADPNLKAKEALRPTVQGPEQQRRAGRHHGTVRDRDLKGRVRTEGEDAD